MRESGIKSYDPGFKSPLYPFIQIAGILSAIVMIPEMGLLPSIFAMGLVAVGVVWHYLYVRPRVEPRVGAVAKMAERLGERLLERDADAMGLQTELRQIMKERGLRAEDPFIELVQHADYVEVGPDVDPEEIIRRGSDLLARQSGVSRDLILGALLERNHLGETPAEAGVALPHLLLGNRRNPTRHLRFLAEIARRAENPHFIDDWIAADSVDDLAGLLLATEEE